MLVPLETLPGWPEVQEPSVLQVLALLVGAPLLVVVVIAVWTRIHHAVRGNVGVPDVANQPVWVNGRQIEPSTQDEESQKAIDAGYDAVSSRSEETEDEARRGDEVGGASARW